MPFILVTPPAAEPVSLAEAKAHLRVDHSADEALITALIPAAREQVEALTGLCLVTQTWRIDLDAFPGRRDAILVARAPVAAITSVQYVATDGTLTTLAGASIIVLADSGPRPGPAMIVPAYGYDWPDVRDEAAAVRITATCGYGAASAVPAALKAALLLILGDLYAHREAASMTKIEVNPTVERLLASHRAVFWGG